MEQDTNQKPQLLFCQSTEYFPKSLRHDLDAFWKMWGKSVFSLVNSGLTFNIMQSMDTVFAHSLSCCWNRHTDLNWGYSGYFGVTPWMSCSCPLILTLIGRPLVGKFTAVISFLNLWILALTVVFWGTKKCIFSLPRCLICSLFSLDRGIMCWFFEIF